jgi:hypothetical protein
VPFGGGGGGEGGDVPSVVSKCVCHQAFKYGGQLDRSHAVLLRRHF